MENKQKEGLLGSWGKECHDFMHGNWSDDNDVEEEDEEIDDEDTDDDEDDTDDDDDSEDDDDE